MWSSGLDKTRVQILLNTDFPTFGKGYTLKLNVQLCFDLVILLLSVLPKRNEKIYAQKDLYKNIHDSFI